MYGGSIDAGLRPSGGFRVAARLPYDPAEAEAATATDTASAEPRHEASGAGA